MATREDFPSNSKFTPKKDDPERRKVEKVVKSDVKIRKKGFGERLSDDFLASDMKTVGSSVIFDVLIPAAKDAISNMVKGMIDGLLFGSGSTAGRTYRDRDQTRVYRRYEQYADTVPKRNAPTERTNSRYSDPIFSTREDADEVLVGMLEIIDEYDVATVKDLYGFIGRSADYTTGEYGWYNLDDAKIIRVRDGFMLKLPKPKVVS